MDIDSCCERYKDSYHRRYEKYYNIPEILSKLLKARRDEKVKVAVKKIANEKEDEGVMEIKEAYAEYENALIIMTK